MLKSASLCHWDEHALLDVELTHLIKPSMCISTQSLWLTLNALQDIVAWSTQVVSVYMRRLVVAVRRPLKYPTKLALLTLV